MPGTFCPLNKFGIKDYEQLHLLETPLAHRRQLQLDLTPLEGNFDTGHLRKIHWFLFRDVFPWAGEFRQVQMSKIGGAPFAAPQFIAPALTALFAELKSENFLTGLSADAFADRAAYYLGEINAIHPFREGNGRTQREFMRELGGHCGFELSWYRISKEANTQASILSHLKRDNSGLRALIDAAMVRKETES